MSSTTYIVRNAKGEIINSRTTAANSTMAYTHALVNDQDGVYSYHNSLANAQKAASGTYVASQGYRPVAVEAHKGTKKAVLGRLAREELVASAKAHKDAKAAATQMATKAAADMAAHAEAKAPAPKATDEVKPNSTPEAKKAAKAKAIVERATKANKAANEQAAPKAPAKTAEELAADRKAAGLAKAQANLEAAVAKGGPVHPGLAWRGQMFALGMTQADTAKAMGIAPMTLNRLFNGHGVPTAKVTVAFAKATGLDATELWQEVANYELALALSA